MSEDVQRTLDGFVPHMREYLDRGVFGAGEIGDIVRRRRESEYLLRRRTPRVSDHLQYIRDEIRLERLRQLRTKKVRLLEEQEDDDDDDNDEEEDVEMERESSSSKRKRPNKKKKKNWRYYGCDRHIRKLIHALWTRTLSRFRYDEELCRQYLGYLRGDVAKYQLLSDRQIRYGVRVAGGGLAAGECRWVLADLKKRLAAAYAACIQRHPKNTSLYIEAASYEYFGVKRSDGRREDDHDDDGRDDGRDDDDQDGAIPGTANGSVGTARILLQRGIRINPNSHDLYLQLFSLELHWVQKLRGRKKLLSSSSREEDDDEYDGGEEMKGDEDEGEGEEEGVERRNRVAWIVYRNAVKRLSSSKNNNNNNNNNGDDPHLLLVRLKFVDLCRMFPRTGKLRRAIMNDIRTCCGTDPQSYISLAMHAWEIAATAKATTTTTTAATKQQHEGEEEKEEEDEQQQECDGRAEEGGEEGEDEEEGKEEEGKEEEEGEEQTTATRPSKRRRKGGNDPQDKDDDAVDEGQGDAAKERSAAEQEDEQEEEGKGRKQEHDDKKGEEEEETDDDGDDGRGGEGDDDDEGEEQEGGDEDDDGTNPVLDVLRTGLTSLPDDPQMYLQAIKFVTSYMDHHVDRLGEIMERRRRRREREEGGDGEIDDDDDDEEEEDEEEEEEEEGSLLSLLTSCKQFLMEEVFVRISERPALRTAGLLLEQVDFILRYSGGKGGGGGGRRGGGGGDRDDADDDDDDEEKGGGEEDNDREEQEEEDDRRDDSTKDDVHTIKDAIACIESFVHDKTTRKKNKTKKKKGDDEKDQDDENVAAVVTTAATAAVPARVWIKWAELIAMIPPSPPSISSETKKKKGKKKKTKKREKSGSALDAASDILRRGLDVTPMNEGDHMTLLLELFGLKLGEEAAAAASAAEEEEIAGAAVVNNGRELKELFRRIVVLAPGFLNGGGVTTATTTRSGHEQDGGEGSAQAPPPAAFGVGTVPEACLVYLRHAVERCLRLRRRIAAAAEQGEGERGEIAAVRSLYGSVLFRSTLGPILARSDPETTREFVDAAIDFERGCHHHYFSSSSRRDRPGAYYVEGGDDNKNKKKRTPARTTREDDDEDERRYRRHHHLRRVYEAAIRLFDDVHDEGGGVGGAHYYKKVASEYRHELGRDVLYGTNPLRMATVASAAAAAGKGSDNAVVPCFDVTSEEFLADRSSFVDAFNRYQVVKLTNMPPSSSTSAESSPSPSSSSSSQLTWKDLCGIFRKLDDRDRESWCVETPGGGGGPGGRSNDPEEFLKPKRTRSRAYCSFLIQADAEAYARAVRRLPVRDLDPVTSSSFASSSWTYEPALWIFFGRNPVPGGGRGEDLDGRPDHTDSVDHDGTWHYQLSGKKTWILRPTRELLDDYLPEKLPDGEENPWDESTRVRVDCERGDVIVINTRLWFHKTVIPPQKDPSVSYARDFRVKFNASSTSSAAAAEGGGGGVGGGGGMTNLDGLYATRDVEADTILFTDRDMPDGELHRSSNPNCAVVEVGDGTSAVVTDRIIKAGEFFTVAETSDEDEGEEEEEGDDDDDDSHDQEEEEEEEEIGDGDDQEHSDMEE